MRSAGYHHRFYEIRVKGQRGVCGPGQGLAVEIYESDKPLPDEEDIYGVNDIDEYDPDYWMPAEQRRYRNQIIYRLIALILAVAFTALALYWRFW